MKRREFIEGLGGVLGTLALGGCGAAVAGRHALPGNEKFKLGLAGYSLNHLKAKEALEFCEQHGFRYLCIKSFHLPFESTPREIAEFLRQCADHGVTPYGTGPIEIRDLEEAKRMFDYTAAIGVKTMVGVPWLPDAQGRTDWKHLCSNEPLCEQIATLAEAYKINFAIHNHGTKIETGVPTLWPTPDAIMKTLYPLGQRMGLCIDVAYTHADGFDVPSVIRKYRGRIFDAHVRCVSDPFNGSSACRPKERSFDYEPVFAAFREIGYEGFFGLEWANDDPSKLSWADWESGLDESRAYFERQIH